MTHSICSTALFTLVVANAAGAADNCKDILAHGVFEVKDHISREQQGSAFLTWYCSSQYSKVSETGDAGGLAGFQISDLPPIMAKGHNVTSKSEEYRNEACSHSEGTFTHASEFSAFSSTASSTLAKEWGQCMNAFGIFASFKTTGPNDFSIEIHRKADIGYFCPTPRKGLISYSGRSSSASCRERSQKSLF